MQDEPLRPFEIKLDGQLITADDPAMIGKNFRSLKNMRYIGQGTNPKGIGGMTRLASTELTLEYPWGHEEIVSWLSCPQTVIAKGNNVYFVATNLNPVADHIFIFKYDVNIGTSYTLAEIILPLDSWASEPDIFMSTYKGKIFFFVYYYENYNNNCMKTIVIENDVVAQFDYSFGTNQDQWSDTRTTTITKDGIINHCFVMRTDPGFIKKLKNYRSVDFGATYTENIIENSSYNHSLSTINPSTDEIFGITFDEIFGITFDITTIGRLYNSTDIGVSWGLVSSPNFTGYWISDMIIYKGNIILALMKKSDETLYVAKSIDDGLNFTLYPVDIIRTDIYMDDAFAIDKDNNLILFGATMLSGYYSTNFIWKSSDGEIWSLYSSYQVASDSNPPIFVSIDEDVWTTTEYYQITYFNNDMSKPFMAFSFSKDNGITWETVPVRLSYYWP